MKHILAAAFMLLAGCSTQNSGGPKGSSGGVAATPTPITLNSISGESDGSMLTVSGNGFSRIKTAQLISKNDGSVIDNLQIIILTDSSLTLKPSKNIQLDPGDYTLSLN